MVNINGEEWTLLAVSPFHPQLQRSDGSYTIGACDDTRKTIYISNAIPTLLMRKVLCHELTHASMFSYDVDLSLDQEELLADLIATYGQEIVFITNKIFNRINENRGT